MGLPDVKVIITGLDRLSNVLAKPMRALDKFGRKTTQIGKSMTRNLTLPIIGLGAAASVASVSINKGMANVATLIPGNIQHVRDLKKEMKLLGEEVGVRSKLMSEGLFQVISAFGDGVDTMEKLRINARGAVAGVSTVKEAIDLTSAVTKAYGDITLKTTQLVVDLGFKANELGQTTFKEMAASVGKVTPMAANLNVTMRELFGVFATATGVTGETSMVSTQLASVLTGLLKPTIDMTNAFKMLGVEDGKALIKQKGLQGSMVALMDLTKKYDVTLGQLFGRKEAMNLMFALTGAQADDFTRKLEAMNHVAGATDKAFFEQTQGINKSGFAWNQFIVKLENTAAKIGDRLVPILVDLGQKYILPLVNWIGGLNDEQVKWIIKIGAVVAAIGPMLVIIGGVAFTIANVALAIGPTIVAIKALGVALLFLTANPIGHIITGIALLTIGIILLVKNWDWVVAKFKQGWAFILGHWKTGVKVILLAMGPMGWAMLGIVKNIDKIKEGMASLARLALPKWLEVRLGLTEGAESIPAGEVLDKVQERKAQESRFSGTLRIVGAPPKSEIEVQEGNIGIEIDSGPQLSGSF